MAHAALGDVDDANEAGVVVRVRHEPDISENIFDLAAIVEAQPTQNPMRHASRDEFFLEDPRLCVGTQQDGRPRIGLVPPPAIEGSSNENGLSAIVLGAVELWPYAFVEARDQALAFSRAVILDDRARRAEDGRPRAIVHLELYGPGVRKVGLKIEDVPQVRTAKVVDGLIFVTDDEDVPVRCEEPQKPKLDPVGVLIFVDEQVAKAPLRESLCPLGALHELHPAQQQIVEVDRTSSVELFLILRRHHFQDLLKAGISGPAPGKSAELVLGDRGRDARQRILALRHVLLATDAPQQGFTIVGGVERETRA